MLSLIILSAVISVGFSINCNEQYSVDISRGVHLPNGYINYNGIQYNSFDYFTDANKTLRGCVCDKKTCVSKCCPIGYAYHKVSKDCVKYDGSFNPPVLDEYLYVENVNASEYFHFTFGKPKCGAGAARIVVSQITNEYYLRIDGKLYTELKHNIPPWMLKTQDKYCVDTFITDLNGSHDGKLDALVCFAEAQVQNNYLMSSTCMLISCVFIIATVAVYGWLPELRNLHGRVLMSYLVCLFVGFLCLSTMQILLLHKNISINSCLALTIIIYFSLLAAFFWLNVMCFDIWWTFSGKRGMTLEKMSIRVKFMAYAAYAFGIPMLLTIIMTALEFSGLPPHPLLPLIRRQGCFLHGRSRLFYLYGPIMVLWIANLIFFILTAVKITIIKRQTSVLKSRESATHDRQKSEKQRLLLYVKLFIVMGINWLLEVISTFYHEADIFWRITDAYNVLIGLIIFILFVCKRKILKLIKKRFRQARGDSISKSQTSTRTFSSTKDEVALTNKT